MNVVLKSLLVSIGVFGAMTFAAHAQTLPAGAPAGSTVQCKDDSFASPDTKSGACRGHKGIKTWYGKAVDAPPAAAAVPAVQTQSAAVSATKVAPSAGGAGKVWANDETKVYHCMGDRYYGKTKKGEYLTEADAKAKGMHASHNKACAA